MQLQKATRKKSKLRLNISGPSGSGKTYSALLMGKGLVGDWSKIAVIDTENGSASLYEHLGAFNTIDLQPPFSPERYIQAIDACLHGGMELIIIDSSSHEWNGPGGCIEINEHLAQTKFKGNTWSAWSQTTPRHDAFVNKVLHAPVHMITCTRSKMETVMTDDKKVKKLGMKDQQREGWEYELTVSLNIDRDTHTAIASKDRTEMFEGKDPFIITEKTGEMIAKWCDSGVDANAAEKEAADKLASDIKTATTGLKKQLTVADLSKYWEKQPAEVRADKHFIHAVTARKAELLKEELTSFIEGLSKVTTPKEHEQYQDIVPAYIVADASFIDAAKKRYNVVMAAPAQ